MFFENNADRLLRRLLSGDSLLYPGWSLAGDSCGDDTCGCKTPEGDGEEESVTAEALSPSVRYYGFVATTGPDGRPVMYEYGNMSPDATGARLRGSSPLHAGRATAQAEREPLVDTIVDEKARVVKLIAEMPGVEKRDIRIAVEDDGRHVSVSTGAGGGPAKDDGGAKKYRMRIPLERRVSPNTAKAMYRNGILQITFNLAEGKQGGRTIRVD